MEFVGAGPYRKLVPRNQQETGDEAKRHLVEIPENSEGDQYISVYTIKI